jgi:putative transposase
VVTLPKFWVRGYCVSTAGLDEQTIRKYIREQKQHQEKFDQDNKLGKNLTK